MKGMYFYPVNIMCCTNILCYLSPEETAIAERKVVWLSFVFQLYIIWVRKGILRFRSRVVIGLFKTLKIIYRPKDSVNPMRIGSICQSFHFIMLAQDFLIFHFSYGNQPFLIPENLLYPAETLESRTQWRPYDRVSILLCQERVLDPFVSEAVIRLFEILKMS